MTPQERKAFVAQCIREAGQEVGLSETAIEFLQENADYDWRAEPDEDGPEGYFATGDDAEDARIVAEIRENMQWNTWAWCFVRVTVSVELGPAVIEGWDSLGGCSYADEEEFTASDYFKDMMNEAALDLCRKMKAIQDVIAKL